MDTRYLLDANIDLWIATHALAAGLTLMTNDEKEFRRAPGLKIQNWTA
jgi:tRNA(fMet)-specific endonuclease VapC